MCITSDGEHNEGSTWETILFAHKYHLSNLINIIDPDVVVLGGGVSNFDAIYTKGVEQVGNMIFNDCLNTPIVKHQIGDSAGVLGAAMIGI